MKSLIFSLLLLSMMVSLPPAVSLGQKANRSPRRKVSTRKKPKAAATQNPGAITLPCQPQVMNGVALSLGYPEYPKAAKAERPSGRVVVRVYVDERGKTMAAEAVSGHPLFQESAVRTAREAIFIPFRVEGKPVKCTGVVTYSFVGQ